MEIGKGQAVIYDFRFGELPVGCSGGGMAPELKQEGDATVLSLAPGGHLEFACKPFLDMKPALRPRLLI